jgi:hypothetical protein
MKSSRRSFVNCSIVDDEIVYPQIVKAGLAAAAEFGDGCTLQIVLRALSSPTDSQVCINVQAQRALQIGLQVGNSFLIFYSSNSNFSLSNNPEPFPHGRNSERASNVCMRTDCQDNAPFLSRMALLELYCTSESTRQLNHEDSHKAMRGSTLLGLTQRAG